MDALNGATVVLKPTTLKRIRSCSARQRRGLSLASDAGSSCSRRGHTGAAGASGRFNAVTLDKVLADKAVGVTPFINEIREGMGGGSTPQDLETMFQLLYLRFTQPRADPVAFAAMASQSRALLANQTASPDVVFDQAIDTVLSGNSPRRQPDTSASVDQWDLAKSLAFYKARFSDASNSKPFARQTPDDRFVETVASLAANTKRYMARRYHCRRSRRKTNRQRHCAEESSGDVPSGLLYDDAHKWRSAGPYAAIASSNDPPGARGRIASRPTAHAEISRPEFSIRID